MSTMADLDSRIEPLDIHTDAGGVMIAGERYTPEEAREIARFIVAHADGEYRDDDDDDETFRVTHTACERCELDVEGFSDEPTVWRDRGGNTSCNAGGAHVGSPA